MLSILVVALALAATGHYPDFGDSASRIVFLIAGWLLGDSTGSRRAYVHEIEEKAERLERERDSEARRIVAEEQARIARELHDVVAHALSVIVVRFYLYPTISDQQTANANLQIGLRERLVAIAQASRFSQVCRVYAPVYRQLTLAAIDKPGGINAADSLVAYRSALSAFRDYLAHYNHGRGIVFVGHSQGASIMIALLEREVDSKPNVRRLLVSALLMGGNVTVPRGRDVGGDFAHIPACRSSRSDRVALSPTREPTSRAGPRRLRAGPPRGWARR